MKRKTKLIILTYVIIGILFGSLLFLGLPRIDRWAAGMFVSLYPLAYVLGYGARDSEKEEQK